MIMEFDTPCDVVNIPVSELQAIAATVITASPAPPLPPASAAALLQCPSLHTSQSASPSQTHSLTHHLNYQVLALHNHPGAIALSERFGALMYERTSLFQVSTPTSVCIPSAH